ncbi:MAG: UvrD-helicase domain-containing protein, partial [Bdellovibrionales bacterium]|nr:UvrD-helicase domain-containing protein [Bdellovibrionales bacterium]
MFSPELVRASAGSGKTFALTSRFLAICAAGESPEKILATTFTRKAAGEILNRIFVRLARACLDQKAAKELGCQIGVPNLSCKGAQSIFIRIIESQHKLQICTLDSFFSSIAKVFAFELRFPPDFTVSKDSSREVLSESISDYLACSNPEEIQTLLNGFHAGALKRSIHDQMLQTVSSLLGLYRASSTDAWMSEFSETLEVELDEIADQLSSISLPKTKAGKENSLWAKSRQQLLDAVKQQDWKTISDNGLIGKFVAGEDSFARVKIPDELKD